MSEETKSINETVRKIASTLIRGVDITKLPTRAEHEAREKAVEDARLMWVAENRKKALKVPKHFLKARSKIVSDSTWGRNLVEWKEYIGKDGLILVLLGSSGTGKTQMAVELLFHGIEKNLTAKFVDCLRLQIAMKRAFEKKEGEEDIIDSLIDPDVLVLDEVDWLPNNNVDFTNTYFQKIFYLVMNSRYGEDKDTIIISNKTKKNFTEETLDSIISRIEEVGWVVDTSEWTKWRTEIGKTRK